MSIMSPSSALAQTTKFPGTWTVTGWIAPLNLSFEEWERVGYALADIDQSFRWLLGDWLVYGEWKYGEKYAQAIDMTRFNFNRLKDYAWVAGNVHISVRTEGLSWSHHREVAKLPPDKQAEWLALALANDWTTRELHDRVSGRLLDRPSEKKAECLTFSDDGTSPAPITSPAQCAEARAVLEREPEPDPTLRALVDTWDAARGQEHECPRCGFVWLER
jgi:hypothetical protein